MRRIILITVLLVSCTKDPQPVAPDAMITLASAAVKTSTVVEEDEVEPEEPEEPEVVAGACAVKVPWSVLPRCKHDKFVYAVGSVEKVRDLALSRTTASDRARRVLFDRPQGKLEGAEVLELARCGKTTFALARVPAANVLAEKTACDAKKLEQHAAPPAGCPGWTVTGVRREGDTIVAVGVARMKNPALAESAAINRARAELARISAVQVAKTVGGGHSHASGEESAFSELGRKKTVCGGNTFVELTAKAIE